MTIEEKKNIYFTKKPSVRYTFNLQGYIKKRNKHKSLPIISEFKAENHKYFMNLIN